MVPLTASFVTSVLNTLDQHGPATARELARLLDVEHGDVWSVLRKLADMAAVLRAELPTTGEDLWWVPVDRQSDGGRP